MCKLGFIVDMSTVKEAADLRKWAEFAVQNNIDGLELQYDYRDNPNFDANLVNDAINGLNVEICSCGFWWENTMAQGEEAAKVASMMENFLVMTQNIKCKMAFFNAGEYEKGNTPENIKHFKEMYLKYYKRAKELGITISCYVGHGGNFINRRNILSRVLDEVPEFNLKLDPVGIMRNMKDDPYEIIKQFGSRCVHFHVKDITRYGCDGYEIEPPVGMGDLKWNILLGMLYDEGYNGYIVIEPHGSKYFAGDDNRKMHIILSKRHIEQFIIR